MDFGIKITNGCIHDGAGSAARRADVGIAGDAIAEIGDLSRASADQEIDATGCIVCPGFIDAHTHSDAYLLVEPSAASKLYQGVTTEICGHCGTSTAPLLGDYKMPSDWLDKPYASRWSTVAEYRDCFEAAPPSVNAALLVGHNTLHAGVCGYEPRGATTDELNAMVRTLEQALDEGAIGLSSGLVYAPGSAAPAEELVELAKTVARHGGVYATHIRSEGARLIEAINEAIDIASRSGARLQISHLKTSGSANWHKLPVALERIHAARERIAVGSDRYPYTAACTDLDIVLPDWASHGGRDAVLARLRSPAERGRIRDELLRERAEFYWGTVMVGSTCHPDNERFKGAYLVDVARQLGIEPVDALLHLLDTDELRTSGIFFGMSEENMWKILAEPYVSIGSDASLRAPWGPLSHDHPHPRAYGSFTRFLRAALDGKTVSLPEAIRKMTSLPAEQYGLAKRGLLRENCFADLLVFDPAAIAENTSYPTPHRLSDGMRHVFVNGVQVLADGKHTGRPAGQLLSR